MPLYFTDVSLNPDEGLTYESAESYLQLLQSHFAIVEGNSKAKIEKANVHSFYWNETTHAKGGNEIISAVYYFLQNFVIPEYIKTLRIVCDGCSGQNKNTGIISMLGKWLYTEAPRHLKRIELIFPVVGHSFIPPDRVFAKIENTLKKKK